jgi:hypothetical protein
MYYTVGMQERQKCLACGDEKPLDEFYKNLVKANGHDAKCKKCRKARASNYRKENADRIAKQRREHYMENRESLLAQKAAYYGNTREARLSQKSDYWHRNKDVIRQRTATWRSRNQNWVKSSGKIARAIVLDEVLACLGSQCMLCGETEREFLTVDHIENDGYLERRLGSLGWKRRIINGTADRSKYRILCHNCNLGRYRLNPVHHLIRKEFVGCEQVCTKCKCSKDLACFSSQSSHSAGLCLDCRRSKVVARRQRLIAELGGTCQCCGIRDWWKLVIDHVNDNGGRQRQVGQRGGIDLLSAIARGELRRSDFQLLCWNCNHSKHRGSGMCIHQRNGTSLLRGVSSTFRNQCTSVCDAIKFSFEQVTVAATEAKESRCFLDEHHYAGFGRPSSIIYAARLDSLVVAVAKFAPPVRQGIAATLGMESKQVLELDRFCIHAGYHKKNFPSWFMTRVLKALKNDRPEILKLVSFADPRFGHTGTIYTASNWKYVGDTARGYYYEDSDGREVNKKTLYEYAKVRKMTERQCFEALGYKRVFTPPKHKFVFTF